MSAHQLKSKNNAHVLLFKTTFRLKNCFLSSAATDAGKNINGHVMRKNLGQFFRVVFNAVPAKISNEKIHFCRCFLVTGKFVFLTLQEQFLYG